MQKRIEVDVYRQRLIAFEGGQRMFEFDCFTGDDSTPTHLGHFFITWKHADHVSSEYHSPMPFALFFDKGRAIHASSHGKINVLTRHLAMRAGLGKLDRHVPESIFKIGSHGCVNLNKEDAAQLFNWAVERTPVIIR